MRCTSAATAAWFGEVEAVERLVEQQQLRSAHQRLGDEQPLLLAAGELADRPVRVAASPRRDSHDLSDRFASLRLARSRRQGHAPPVPSRPSRTTSIPRIRTSGRSCAAAGRSRCAGEPLRRQRRARSPSRSRAAADPRTTFNSVDLPTPLGPRTATNVPGPMARSTPLHSRRSPNRTEAPRVWMTSAEVDASKLASRRVCFIGRSPRAGRLRALGAEPTCQSWNVAPAGTSVSVIVVTGMPAASRLVDLRWTSGVAFWLL